MWYIDVFIADLERHGLSRRTINSYRLHVERFTRWCEAEGFSDCRNVTDAVVARYIIDRIDVQSHTPGWKYIGKHALKRYFSILEHRNVIFLAPVVHARKPTIQSGHYKAIARDELRSILDRFPVETDSDILAKSILETGYSASLRPGEIRHLKIEDVDFAGGRLFIRQAKGRKDRIVPIGAVALFNLKRYLTEVRPRYVGDAGERHVYIGLRSRRRFAHTVINNFIRYRLAKHGFPAFSLHQLRVSSATHMVESGMDVAYAQRILGHTELRTTQSYVQISPNELAKTLARSHPRVSMNERSKVL